jgi:hypothetical protein
MVRGAYRRAVKTENANLKRQKQKGPDTPPIEVKREIANPTASGIAGLISILATGKYTFALAVKCFECLVPDRGIVLKYALSRKIAINQATGEDLACAL